MGNRYRCTCNGWRLKNSLLYKIIWLNENIEFNQFRNKYMRVSNGNLRPIIEINVDKEI